MNFLFEAVYQAFLYICKATGLHYCELNILVYCLLIPFSWAFLVFLRNKKMLIFPLLHFVGIMAYLLEKKTIFAYSKSFYDKNIHFLEQLASQKESAYIEISVIIGIFIPITFYAGLWFIPKRYLLAFYALLMSGLLSYEGYVYLS